MESNTKCHICEKYWSQEGKITDNKCDNCGFDYTSCSIDEIERHPHFIIKRLKKEVDLLFSQLEAFITISSK